MKELIGRGNTACLDNPGLAEGTTVTITSANAISFAIDGKIYSKAATTNDALDTTTDATTGSAFVAQAALTAAVYVYGLNAAGETGAAKGTEVTINASGDYIAGYPQFPALPDDFCPVGYITIKNASLTVEWTFNTTAWTTTSVTTDFQEVMTLPDRPQNPATA